MKFIIKPVIFENTDVISRPIFHLDEVADMNEKALNNLKTELKIPKDVLNSFKIKQELCPDIWKNDKLNPQVRTKLKQIATDFFEGLETPANIKIKDILFVGSLANYNWSKFSDVDLHVVLDFSQFEDDKDFIKKHFDAEKNLWNQKHSIEIEGFPVEIYVQDVKEKLHASAIYSVKTNKWVLEPDKTNFKADKALITRKVQKIFDKLKDIKKDYDAKKMSSVIKKVDKVKEEIKKMRKAGLEKGGEYSIENLIFKVLRRTEFMDLLDSFKNKAYDQETSLKEGDEKIIPYDERPELNAARRTGIQNRTISREQLKKFMAGIINAKRIAEAFTEAFKNNERDFEVVLQAEDDELNVEHKVIKARIPDVMFDAIGLNGKPIDYSTYFNVPELGDGGFKIALYKNGLLKTGNVKTDPNATINNMGAATDAGYNKSFDDKVKYFYVKAGIKGKYQNEGKTYSVFGTPAIDAAIKAKAANFTEMVDFVTPSKSYTADMKGKDISNKTMEREPKINKILKDAEQILNYPLAKSAFWTNWKRINLELLSPEQFQNLDVLTAAKSLANAFKSANPNKERPELSMGQAAIDAQAAKSQAAADNYAKFQALKAARTKKP